MSVTEEFRSILDAYQEDLDALAASLRPGDGVFGFGRVPGNDPCHERFDAKVAALAERLLPRAEDGVEEAELAGLLLRCDSELSLPVYAQGMLIAIQRHALPLIPCLGADEARELTRWYEKQYPFYRRAPIQKDILKALKQASRA